MHSLAGAAVVLCDGVISLSRDQLDWRYVSGLEPFPPAAAALLLLLLLCHGCGLAAAAAAAVSMHLSHRRPGDEIEVKIDFLSDTSAQACGIA
jgi:hypothetical protein